MGLILGAIATSVVSVSDFQSIIDAITAQVSVSTVVGVLAAVAAIAIALVFMWWGVRKAAKIIMASFRSGKLTI